MNILFLAPQPFYQDRGTPIAIDNILHAFSNAGENVDVVTYNEGENLVYHNVSISRIPDLSFLQNVRPGFSVKKLIADFLMFFIVIKLLFQNRYDYIHAVEESVYIALFCKLFFRIQYVYDMDSSLASQLVEKNKKLEPVKKIFDFLEGFAIRHAILVVPVCDALADIAYDHAAAEIILLYDIPIIEEESLDDSIDDFREKLDSDNMLVLYVGNLESYQGIDLLLKSFNEAIKLNQSLTLVIIGGNKDDIEKYREMSRKLHIDEKVHFTGPRPLPHLKNYLNQADILVSPRVKGDNTPMKIYSYMASGKPIVATDLWTHTQVLTEKSAFLAAPEPQNFAAGILQLAEDPSLRKEKALQAMHLINTRYNRDIFNATVQRMLTLIQTRVNAD